MPEARMKREASEPGKPITSTGDQHISAASVMSTFEQICFAMSASGAVVAVRDAQGIRCLASIGEAPAVGSRLQSDSAFTRQCIEAGEVVLCEDTENDSRIQPSIAKSLNFRSAVAVPIQSQGSVVGVIEVFSSQPSAIYPTGVAALRRIANLFAPIVAPEFVPGAPPVVGGSTPTLAQAAAFSAAEEQPGHQPFVTVSSPEYPVDSPPPTTEQESVSVLDTHELRRAFEQPEALARSGAEPSASRRLAWEPSASWRLARVVTPARAILVGAASLLLLAPLFLFMFMGSRHRGMKTSTDSAAPPATDRARNDEAGIKPTSTSPPDFVLDRTLKGHSGWVTGVAFSSSGPLASGSWDQTVKVWDVRTGQQLPGLSGKVKQVQALAFSRDGQWLAAENSSNAVTLWNATTGREIRTLPSDKPLGALGTSWVFSIAFSPDGRWLASGVDNKTVRIWDMSTGRKARDLTGSRRSVIYVAFSPDGRFLASGNDNKSIRIWDVSSGEEIRTLSGHKKPIFAVAFSPNGRWLASASSDKTIKIWDVADGHEVRTLTGHRNGVTSLAFSPDGRWLASGSCDKTIKLWDVPTGQELQTLGPHAHPIFTVAFDSRGRWLASGSEDGTINLWRLSDAVNRNGLQ